MNCILEQTRDEIFTNQIFSFLNQSLQKILMILTLAETLWSKQTFFFQKSYKNTQFRKYICLVFV